MMIHRVYAAAVCTVLLLPLCAAWSQANRSASTSEERTKALEYIHSWQADPLGSQAKDQFGWVLKWFAEVPDLTVHVCTILDKLPKGEKKDASVIFGAEFMGQAAYVIENAGKNEDRNAELLSGVQGALHTYEFLVQQNPKDRQSYLDDLIKRRDAGTLPQYVQERAQASCK